MVALINQDESILFEIDNNFSTSLTMKDNEESLGLNEFFSYTDEPFLAVSGSNASTTLELSQFNKKDFRLSTRGIYLHYYYSCPLKLIVTIF